MSEPTLDTSRFDPEDPAHAAPPQHALAAVVGAAGFGQAIDYSQGIPTGAQVHAAGFPSVERYLPKRNPSIVHVLTRASYLDKTGNGVSVGLLYEDTSASRCGQGKAAGVTDAQWALAQARALIGANPRCIKFCVDYDADPSAVIPYFQGTLSVVGKSVNGAYGSYSVIKALFDAGLITWGMQCQAWSYGQVEPRAQLYQRVGTIYVGGTACDASDRRTADTGAHPAPAQPAPPAPQPPQREIFDMSKYVIIYCRDNAGNYYEANLLSGTYWHIPNPQAIGARQKALDAAGIEYAPGHVNVTDMSAYGVQVGK